MDSIREYPRLIRRVRAVLIDSAIAIFVIYSWWMMLPLLEGYPVVIRLAYPIIVWVILDPILVSSAGYTPGHYAMGLRVQDAKTVNNIGLLRAILRSLFRTLTGWWSFILVLATKKHQALLDLLVGTVVVLCNPESLAQSERAFERSQDGNNFIYPSRVKRILVIVIYLILSFIAMVLLNMLCISEDCLNNQFHCSTLDAFVSYATSILLFLSVGGIIVYGWRCQLLGARKKPMVDTE